MCCSTFSGPVQASADMVISLELNRPSNADLTVMVAGGGPLPGACRQYMEISAAPWLPAGGRHGGMDCGVGMGADASATFSALSGQSLLSVDRVAKKAY